MALRLGTSRLQRLSALAVAGAMFVAAAAIVRPSVVSALSVASGGHGFSPSTAAEVSRLSRVLGPSFATVNTGTFVLLTDAPGDRLAAYADALESFASRYTHEIRALGIEPTPLEEPLLVVVFTSHNAFERFAREVDGVNATTMGGYYHTGANRAALYDGASSAAMVQASRALDEVRFAVEHARRRALSTDDQRLASLLSAWARDTAARIGEEETRLAAASLDETIGRLVHEGAHVLTHNTGVFSRTIPPPAWLSEGMAESFAHGEMSGSLLSAPSVHTPHAWRIVHVVTPPGACAEEPGSFYEHCRVVFDTLLREAPDSLAACLRDAATWRGDAADLFSAHFGDPEAYASRFGAALANAPSAD